MVTIGIVDSRSVRNRRLSSSIYMTALGWTQARRSQVSIAVWAGVLLVAVIFPYLSLPKFWLGALVLTICYIPAAVGQNLITGNSGQLAMGQAAFVGIGAFTAGYLATTTSFDGVVILILTCVSAGLAGAIVGFPALRIVGDYLFVVTLGVNLIVIDVALAWESVTGGASGISGVPALQLFGHSVGFGNGFYYASLGLIVLACLATWCLTSSGFGRTVEALRDDEVAAVSIGVRPAFPRTVIFAIGSALAGLSGALLAYNLSYVGYATFDVTASILIFEMAVIGGLGRIPGSVLGAALVILVPEILRPLQPYRELIGGALMIALMIYRPQGLLGYAKITNLIKK